ncbi:hypothetical protein LCGC14_0575110 [marine sediment metagenome]|uniref:Uncharacterized protein n=1 Tax=marine sediment metagenome TaxID=412755 RepID=A0A0F9URD5_9ZZZZ
MGGGDPKLIESFIRQMIPQRGNHLITNTRDSLESHLMVFVAEDSRLKGTIVDMKKYRKNLHNL